VSRYNYANLATPFSVFALEPVNAVVITLATKFLELAAAVRPSSEYISFHIQSVQKSNFLYVTPKSQPLSGLHLGSTLTRNDDKELSQTFYDLVCAAFNIMRAQ
jgi:hypothetical protein